MSEDIEVPTCEQLGKLLNEQRCMVGRAWSHPQMQPRRQNEAIYHAISSRLRAIEQPRRDADDRCNSSRGKKYTARDSNQASGTADAGFSPQLLLPCSVLSQREEPRFVENLSDGWTEHGWEVLPPLPQRERRCSARPAGCPSPPQHELITISPISGLNIRDRTN